MIVQYTCRNMSATVQINFRHLIYLPRNVSYCQQMSGVLPRNVRYISCIPGFICQVVKCHIHDLFFVAGMAGTTKEA